MHQRSFDTHRLVPSNPDKQQRPIVPKPFFHGLVLKSDKNVSRETIFVRWEPETLQARIRRAGLRDVGLRGKLVFLAVGWRGHCDARSGNWGALFVFEGATRRRERALE
jgi:hypothetical protein